MKKRSLMALLGTAAILCLAVSGCGKKETVSVSAESTEAVTTRQVSELDFDTLKDLKKATLQVTKDGETRDETAANKEDLERFSQQLFVAERSDEAVGTWNGRLILEREDQEEVTLELSFENGLFLRAENSPAYRLPEGSEDVVWSMFSTLKGWVAYGSQVRLEMVEKTVKPDTGELVMKVFNETGSPIEYIASPVIYRQMEDGSFRLVESIGGFCGFVSNLDGEEALVKIPWKDMFEATEPGTYKVEIQAMKEETRWEIWDTFNLEN